MPKSVVSWIWLVGLLSVPVDIAAAQSRTFDHLVTLLDERQALGVAFVSLGEGIDCTTPAGRLQLHILAALAEFERARIAERVQAGLQGARRQGKRGGCPTPTSR